MENNRIKKALVIVNPKAGKIRVKSQVMDLTGLGMCGIAPTMYLTGKRGDATEFVKNMADYFDFIICRGGDGTFNEVINGIMALERRKAVGYIPSGTTNDLAKSLSIPLKTKRALEIIVSGSPRKHDIGLFNCERYFSYIASFGSFTEVAYITPQNIKNSLGHLAYMLEAVGSVKNIHPIKTKAIIDGEEINDEFVFVSVSNSLSVGKVMRLDEKTVNLCDGKMEIMLVKNPKTFTGWRNTLYAAKAVDYSKCDTIIYKSGKEFEFFFEENVHWTIDGEHICGGKHVKITVCPKAIEIFR